MSLINLPAELQTEVLIQIFDTHCHWAWLINSVIETKIVPYIQANRAALHSWRRNRRLILRRVARLKLTEAEDELRDLQRQAVLAHFRVVVWMAAFEHHATDFYDESFDIASDEWKDALAQRKFQKQTVDEWRAYALR
jgi:hypothetical protein